MAFDQESLKSKPLNLSQAVANGGAVETLPNGYRLTIPAGAASTYRLAQLDDTRGLWRSDFLHQPPCRLSLRARVSAVNLPGTWGFGLWNDPFTTAIGLGGGVRKMPALPQTAWFFHASPANGLTLRDDLPPDGFLAAVFSSRRVSPLLLAPAALAAPFLLWRVTARWLRRLARGFICEDSTRLEIDPTAWHHYQLEWRLDGVRFFLDEQVIFQTATSPTGPLGLVIWIDNQYASFTADGRLSYGLEVNPEPAWLEIDPLTLESAA